MHNMNISSLDLNLLVALDTLLTEQCVTLAAQRVGWSQSAMSHALGGPRETFEDPVLVRRSVVETNDLRPQKDTPNSG